MQEKVEGWAESVRTLAGVARKHPLSYVAPEVSAPRYHLYPHPAEVFRGPGYILLQDHQDALGGFGKVSPGRPLQLEVPEVSHDIAKCPPRPRVIRIPWLVDLGMVHPQDPYEGEDPDAISDHGEGVPLGHALLAVQEVALPGLGVPDHECGPVVVAVVCEPRATRPLVPDSP